MYTHNSMIDFKKVSLRIPATISLSRYPPPPPRGAELADMLERQRLMCVSFQEKRFKGEGTKIMKGKGRSYVFKLPSHVDKTKLSLRLNFIRETGGLDQIWYRIFLKTHIYFSVSAFRPHVAGVFVMKTELFENGVHGGDF